MSREDERKRRSSYFPNAALNKGYSLDSRFMGGLQPSPTGSYYNSSRYAGEGFSQQQLGRIQGNLATNYTKDQEFNRLANPRFQTGQDTGYSSTAPFGSGRSSAATTQNYAQTYGRPSGNGLSTFDTPSGGSITYRPSGRRLSGGLPGGGAQPIGATTFGKSQQDAFQLGDQGALTGIPSTPYQKSYAMGFNGGGVTQEPTTAGYQLGSLASNVAGYLGNKVAGLFRGAGNQYANPSQNATPGATPQTGPDSQYFAYNSTPAPRRYFDY